MKYAANYNVGNGTHLSIPLTGTNKRDLARRIRALCVAETPKGTFATWSVWEQEGACNLAAAGNVRR